MLANAKCVQGANKLYSLFDNFYLPGEVKELKVSRLIREKTRDPRAGMGHLPFSFKGHEFEEDWLNDLSPWSCFMKPAQAGATEMAIRKQAILACVYGLAMGFSLPTQTLMRDFKNVRIDPVINASPYLTENLGRQTNNQSTTLWLSGGVSYYMYSFTKSANYAKSLQGCIVDEYDRTSPEFLEALNQRFGHEGGGIKNFICTPTLPEWGIHAQYLMSCQRVLKYKCEACTKWEVPTFESIMFKDNVSNLPDFYLEMPERQSFEAQSLLQEFKKKQPYLGCIHCRKRLNRVDNKREWVKTYREREYSGWSMNRAHLPRLGRTGKPVTGDQPGIGHTAWNLIEDFFSSTSLAEYCNQAWGLPYSSGNEGICKTDITAVSENQEGYEVFPEMSYGPCFMGIDQKNILNITIIEVYGTRMSLVHVSEYELTQKDPEFFQKAVEYISDLFYKFNVRFISIDAEPDVSFPHALEMEFGVEVILSHVSGRLKDPFTTPPVDSISNRKCSVNRAWMLDQTRDLFKNACRDYKLSIPKYILSDPEGEEFCKHLQNMLRTEEPQEDKVLGLTVMKPVWKTKSYKRDDYFLAFANSVLALHVFASYPEYDLSPCTEYQDPVIIPCNNLLGGTWANV